MSTGCNTLNRSSIGPVGAEQSVTCRVGGRGDEGIERRTFVHTWPESQTWVEELYETPAHLPVAPDDAEVVVVFAVVVVVLALAVVTVVVVPEVRVPGQETPLGQRVTV